VVHIVKGILYQMAQELKLLIILLSILCTQFTCSHSLILKRNTRAAPRRTAVTSVLNDEPSSEDLRAILGRFYMKDLHHDDEGKDSSEDEPLDFPASRQYTSLEKLPDFSSTSDQLQMIDNKAIPTLKRFSEFLGGKRKRFSEFLGGKRKRFSEFLGGKKRYSEFLGGKKRVSSTEVFDINNKRFSEFLGGKRSSVLNVLDPAESMELASDTSSLFDQQVLEY